MDSKVIEVKFSKNEVLQLLEEYYKRLEERGVTSSVVVEKNKESGSEQNNLATKFSIEYEVEIAGMKKNVKEQISNEEVTTALKAVFGLYEIELVDIEICTDSKIVYSGYYTSDNVPYFKGINVKLKKQKEMKKNKKQ